jgi:PhnB protein
MNGVTPHLVMNDAAAALEFYTKAFGAKELVRLPGKDGRLIHASMEINGGIIMMVDEFPEMQSRSPTSIGGNPVTLHLAVNDAKAVVARAQAAGATVVMEPRPMFWGDLYGMVSDPFGYTWSVGQPLGEAKTGADLVKAYEDAVATGAMG